MSNVFDNMPSLDQAEVSSKEFNPFAYDISEYPTIMDMMNSYQFNSDDVYTIDLMELSNDGYVVRDDMQKYLSKKSNSSSALKEVLKTPFHYFFYTNQKVKDDKKEHFDLGTFAHMAFLEPEAFDKVIIEPDYPLNTKDGACKKINWFEKTNGEAHRALDDLKIQDLRSYLEELKAICPYSLIEEDHQIIIDAIRYGYNTYGGGIIKKILKGAISETSFYGHDRETGLPVKVRPDYFNIEENIGVNAIISFKTTAAQSLSKFIYDSAKFQYELSEGMYQEVVSNITGRKFNVTIMIMMQTVPPYLPAIFWWSPADLQNGKYKYRFALNTVRECLDKKTFPGFDAAAQSGNSGIIEMEQPAWAQKIIHPVDIDE